MRISLLAFVLGASLAFTSSAAATAYTVNSNADPATECLANGQLTLREAVTAANQDSACGDAPAGGAMDTVAFALAPGARAIALKETLRVSARLSLDGGGVVELVGDGAGAAGIGVELFRHIGSTVRGLTIRGFARSGIESTCFAFTDIPCGSHVITGNRIGTDNTGTLARPNGFGVFVYGGFSNVLGGGSASERNIISGNTSIGVYLLAGATLHRVEGNFIGVAVDGVTALPNRGEAGVVVGGGAENVIGGDIAHGNVIAGNTRSQVAVYGNGVDASSTFIQGNLIGVGADGVTPVQGGSAAFAGMPAVDISGDVGMRAHYTILGGDPAHRNVIGNQGFEGDGVRIGAYADSTIVRANFIGLSASRAVAFGHAGCGVSVLADATTTYLGSEADHGTNVIARNARGVCVYGGTGTRLFREEIIENLGAGVHVFPGAVVEIVETVFRDNAGLGIDVSGVGVSPGAPMITRADPDEVELRVTGEANTSVHVEVFLSTDPADESGRGEASAFLGKAEAFTDASGVGTVSIAPSRALVPGERVTATATFAGATSEHAENFMVPDENAMTDAGVPAEDASVPAEDASTNAPEDAGVDAVIDVDAGEGDDAGVMPRKHGGCSAGGGGGGGGGGVLGLVMMMLVVRRRRLQAR